MRGCFFATAIERKKLFCRGIGGQPTIKCKQRQDGCKSHHCGRLLPGKIRSSSGGRNRGTIRSPVTFSRYRTLLITPSRSRKKAGRSAPPADPSAVSRIVAVLPRFRGGGYCGLSGRAFSRSARSRRPDRSSRRCRAPSRRRRSRVLRCRCTSAALRWSSWRRAPS